MLRAASFLREAQGRRTVGLNLGGQWTDGTGMTENGICVDRRLTKISEDLVFEYDRGDYMKPWRVRTAATDRIGLLLRAGVRARVRERQSATATSRTATRCSAATPAASRRTAATPSTC